jgi:hypothetical protein
MSPFGDSQSDCAAVPRTVEGVPTGGFKDSSFQVDGIGIDLNRVHFEGRLGAADWLTVLAQTPLPQMLHAGKDFAVECSFTQGNGFMRTRCLTREETVTSVDDADGFAA